MYLYPNPVTNLRFNFNKKIVSVFLIALIIRGILFLNVVSHPQVIFQPDSRMYVSLAQGLRQYGTLCYPDRPEQPDVERVPGYPLFLASIFWLFGENFLAVVMIQIILDSLSCVLVYHLGEAVWRGTGLISGILAALNMGMITYSQFILNDSLFLFIFLLLLLIVLKFIREREWKLGAVLGAGMGIAALIRPVVAYLPLLLIPFFLFYSAIKSEASLGVSTGKAIFIGIIFILTLSPWLIRNYVHYGRFRLTAQSGEHLLQYIVPFVWQYSNGIPFIDGMKRTSREFQGKARKEGLDLTKIAPFEKSDNQVEMAIDYLKKAPKGAIAKAWIFGIIKNLFAPAIIDLSYLLNIERPHFFYTQGKRFFDRALNFVRNIKGFFGWVVVISLITLVLTRLLQLWGLVQALRYRIWDGIFLFMIMLYFLLLSGPVGYAKYRLPIEPILIILMAVGIKELYAKLLDVRGRR